MADQNVMGNGTDGPVRNGSQDALAEPVRRAEVGDIYEIASMAKAYEGDKWWWTPQRIAEDLDFFFVEGKPAHAFIRAEPFENSIVLTLIYVKPEWHRKGVATRLLKALEEVGNIMGAEQLVNCGPKTPEVFKLYYNRGWSDAGKTPQGYQILVKGLNHVQDS